MTLKVNNNYKIVQKSDKIEHFVFFLSLNFYLLGNIIEKIIYSMLINEFSSCLVELKIRI